MGTEATGQGGPLPQTEAEARRLASALRESETTAALMGGVAVYLRCPAASRPPLRREYKDIDLVTVRSMVQKLTDVLEQHGHAANKRFNALHGRERLFFWDELNQRQLDVFVDRFEMCHAFDFRDRVSIDRAEMTLPLADLLLTKMQVVEMNFKDMMDIAALLQDCPLSQSDDGINIEYITRLTGNDWGLQHTLELTMDKLCAEDNLVKLSVDEAPYPLPAQLQDLRRAMQDAPKSTGWKLRARLGERKRWYELPEESRA